MKPVKIVVKDEVGREVTEKGTKWGTFSGPYLEDYKDASYPAPSIPDGEHTATLEWQLYEDYANRQLRGEIDGYNVWVLAPATSPNKQLEEAAKEDNHRDRHVKKLRSDYNQSISERDKNMRMAKSVEVAAEIRFPTKPSQDRGINGNNIYTEAAKLNQEGFIIGANWQSQRVVELEGEVERLREVLKNISQHVRLNHPTMYEFSTVYHLASKALNE